MDNSDHINEGMIVLQRRIGELEQTVRNLQEEITTLTQIKESYRSIIDYSLQGLLIYQNNHIVFANFMVSATTGYTIDELLAMSFDDLNAMIHPDDRDFLWERSRNRFAGKPSPIHHIFRIIRKDGEIRWFEGISSLIEYYGHPASQLAYMDITDRKCAENLQQQAYHELEQCVQECTADLSFTHAELSRAIEVKDRFLAVMSHELRTPLNGIIGMSQALQERVYGEMNEKQMRALQSIEQSGYRLLSVINDILDLSRIDSGNITLQYVTVSIETICRATLQLIAEEVQRKHIHVSFVCQDQSITMFVDANRLKQILFNLLSNAVKFTPERGQIGLNIQINEPEHIIQFIIWDTGIGIAREDINRLFKPFVQLDSKLSRHYEGIGLGLVLAQRLTELHGGNLRVESEFGEGSRFIVSLPICVAGSQEDMSGKAQNQRKRDEVSSPFILLGEDNEMTIRMLSEFLEHRGYRVLVARNGAEVIERMRDECPSLVLMDIKMPHMDGLEAIRRIRAEKRFADVPIIALTALTMPEDRELCLEAGANNYLSKPINMQKLIQMIEHLGICTYRA